MRIQLAATAAALLLASCGSGIDNKTCAKFMAGAWRGEGTIDLGVQVKSTWTLKPDGSFNLDSSYQNKDGTWQDSTSSGTWTAGPGTQSDQCIVTQTTAGGGMTVGSPVTIVDADTISSHDLDMKRVTGK